MACDAFSLLFFVLKFSVKTNIMLIIALQALRMFDDPFKSSSAVGNTQYLGNNSKP